jgi:hypothetical protein
MRSAEAELVGELALSDRDQLQDLLGRLASVPLT